MIALLLALAFVLFLVHQFWYRRLNYPPGPLPLPFIGNVHSLFFKERWEHKFLEWKQQYGNIYTYYIGPTAFVSVNDYKTAVEMFVKDGANYEDRVSDFDEFLKVAREGTYGLINSSGSLWREQRRFALRVLRDFGLGKNQMQERILEEIQTICENVNKDIASGIDEHDFHKHTDLATGSVINAVVCGYRFSAAGKEKEFYMMKKTVDQIMEGFTDPIFSMAMGSPFLAKLPVFKPRFDKIVNLFAELFNFLEGIIEDHIKNNDYSGEVEARDFIDAYLIEMNRSEERGESHYFSRVQLRNALLDLWFAGQETTSSTLTWAIAYLVVHQDAQSKMHEELDRVIGSERMITVTDKQDLPYCNAVIMESQRLANIITANLLHSTRRDININGRTVKKGSIMVPQISVMMIDPENFDNPKAFNPSRFIDQNGNFKPAEEVVPFSIGKRQCLGEGLARMELFLFMTNIFNQYKLTAGDVPPALKKVSSGISVATKPYKVRVERRYK